MNLLPLCTLLAIAAPLCAQTPTRIPAWSQDIEKAWKLAAAGDRKGAEAILRQAETKYKPRPEVYLLLGSLLAQDGERDEAIAQLRHAAELDGKSANAFIALGEAYRQFGEREAARVEFLKVISLRGSSSVAEQNLGALALEEGKHEEARQYLNRAISLPARPEDKAECHYLLAKIDSSSGHAHEALLHLEKAVVLRPKFAQAWSDLGEQRRLEGNEAGALDAFERAVALDGADAVAQYRLGSAYLRRGSPERALAPLETASRLSPDDQSSLNALQSALRQLGRANEAAEVKDRLSELLRRRDRASQNALVALKFNNQGAELEKGGKLAEAVECYRRAVELNSSHAGMRVNYGVALLRTGAWREGLEQLGAARHLDPNDNKIQLALRDAIAQAPAAALPSWAHK